MKMYHHFSSDLSRRLVSFKMSGLWTVEYFKEFYEEFKKNVDEVSSTGRGFFVFVDMTDFLPQTEEVQLMIKDAMGYATRKGMKRAAHQVTRVVTDMQTSRLSREAGIDYGQFESEEEALEWLLKEER